MGKPNIITKLLDHIAGTADKHNANKIVVEDTGDNWSATDVENVLIEMQNQINNLPYSILWKSQNTFNSTTGVVITHDLGTASYRAVVTPTTNPNGYLGEIWVDKAVNTCTVYCSGNTTTTEFDIVLIKN